MKGTKTVEINTTKVEKAEALLRAVAHKLRLKIITLINSQPNGEMNVNQIYNTLKIEQSITSQHLKVLREANVVETRREGKKIFYFLNHKKLTQMNEGIDKFALEEVATATKKVAKKK